MAHWRFLEHANMLGTGRNAHSVALYVPCALAAKQATREIPIVIIAADPVETGIVASLARPGGNITGVSLMSAVFV